MQSVRSTGDMSYLYHSQTENDLKDCHAHHQSPSNLSEVVNGMFNENDPQIQHDTIRIILQYLSSHGYTTSAVVLQEESGMAHKDNSSKYSALNNLGTKVMEGDWEDVECLIKENCDEEQCNLYTYLIHKQVFLEFISRNEYQKAHHYLFKHIKPIEQVCEDNYPGEFKELCYLLSVKTITSSPYFKHWPGITKSREILLKTLSQGFRDNTIILEKPIPDNRLVSLLKQACCFQMMTSSTLHHPIPDETTEVMKAFCYDVNPSLLEDYETHPIPSSLLFHSPCSHASVKSVLLHNTDVFISAGNSIMCIDQNHSLNEFGKQESTIWSLALSCDHQNLLSGSSDGIMKIWSVNDRTSTPRQFITNHGDIYSIAAHPHMPYYLMNGNFDGSVQIWNTKQQKVVKEYQPHAGSVTTVAFNPAGNLLFSGGKDRRIEIWDLISCCQVSSFSKNLKEITGLDISLCGNLIAVASRSNCHALVDTRTNAIEVYFRGVMNIRSNFLRIHFLGDNIIYSGSENGDICIWDIRTQQMISRLKSPCGCGSALDCRYCKETGSLFCGYDNGDVAIWGN